MRMWMIDPKLLCSKHLLGEHGEIHKFRHTFVKKHKIMGRLIPKVQIEPASMSIRHHELANEMLLRGFEHQSPYVLPDLSYLPDELLNLRVNPEISITDLIERCPDCKTRILTQIKKGVNHGRSRARNEISGKLSK